MANSIIETITPEKAQVYLNMSGGNRNISERTVEMYASAMENGDWMLNGDSIRFDINQHLIDGHHRLYACIKAGVPFKTFVTRGLEEEVKPTIDNGRGKNLGQLIGMNGFKHYSAIASSLQFAYRLTHSLSVLDNSVSLAKTRAGKSNLELMRIFDEDREGYAEAGEISVHYRSIAPLMENSVVGGVFYYLTRFGQYPKEMVIFFFDELLSYDSSKVVTINEMRKVLIANKSNPYNKKPRQIIFAMLVKTWNYYVTGKTVKRILFNADKEEYPQFILNNNK